MAKTRIRVQSSGKPPKSKSDANLPTRQELREALEDQLGDLVMAYMERHHPGIRKIIESHFEDLAFASNCVMDMYQIVSERGPTLAVLDRNVANFCELLRVLVHDRKQSREKGRVPYCMLLDFVVAFNVLLGEARKRKSNTPSDVAQAHGALVEFRTSMSNFIGNELGQALSAHQEERWRAMLEGFKSSEVWPLT